MDPVRREQWIEAGERAAARDIEREIYKQADKEDTYQTQALIPDGMCIPLHSVREVNGVEYPMYRGRIVTLHGRFNLCNGECDKVVYWDIDPALVEQLVILFGLDEL